MQWITEGFEGFSKGTMGNGGQNLYVSKKGVLQRIFQYDINQDGHPDILFACSQSMGERPPVYVYTNPLKDDKPLELPTWGIYDGLFADLNGDGYDDLVVASQHDGTHDDVPAMLYFGNKDGLSEQYHMELPAPNSFGVCAGDFRGRGKKDLAFLSNGKIRVFYQQERGFNPGELTDYEINAVSAAAGDLNGDGYCDLYFKTKDGKLGILFGGPDGFDAEKVLWLQGDGGEAQKDAQGTTAGLASVSDQWHAEIVKINGRDYLFSMDGDDVVLSSFDGAKAAESFRLHAPGAVAVAAADLDCDGYDDLAVAVFKDRDEEADCLVFMGGAQGFVQDRVIRIPVKSAANVSVADINGPVLIICRMGERVQQEVISPAFRIADGKAQQIGGFLGGDCMRVVAGYPMGREAGVQIAMMNHKMHRDQGGENVYIYLGGEDGYQPDRRIELPAHSAVEGVMCDIFDSGNVDVLVNNCFEDAIYLDDGSYIYTNDGNGVDPNRVIKLPTVRSHGVAIGDFRKSGYLDLAFGGFYNRELRILHGSEKGYSLENSTKILLGPDRDPYEPMKMGKDGWTNRPAPGSYEANLMRDYGEVRWLIAMDFNGDGWEDLFVSEITGPRCYILWGGPDGFSWENRLELMADGVSGANIADLNGNGYPDLILCQHMSTKKKSIYESYVTVYWGGPDGYQENRKMQLPVSCANSVTVGDYNGNGSLDIYATAYNNGRYRDLLSYLYPGDHGKYSVRNVKYLFNHSGSGCVSGDFNGDGYTDLAVACHKEYGDHCSHSFIFWGGPDGLSDERKTVLPTTGPHGMSVVDPGNILDRGPREFYTSEAITLPAGAAVKSIAWEGKCTSTSWVETELRCAADEAGLKDAEWVKVEAGADIAAMNIGGAVQYRLALCAKCACGTPRITRVTVEY